MCHVSLLRFDDEVTVAVLVQASIMILYLIILFVAALLVGQSTKILHSLAATVVIL